MLPTKSYLLRIVQMFDNAEDQYLALVNHHLLMMEEGIRNGNPLSKDDRGGTVPIDRPQRL